MTMGHVVALLSGALSGGVVIRKVEDDGDDGQQCCRYGRHDDHHLAGCCVSRFRDGKDIWRLPCGHAFHRDCIDRWLALCRWTTCPLCHLHGAGGAAEDDQHQLSDDLVI